MSEWDDIVDEDKEEEAREDQAREDQARREEELFDEQLKEARKDFLTVEQVSRLWRLGRSRVSELVGTGQLPGVKIENRWMIHYKTVREFRRARLEESE